MFNTFDQSGGAKNRQHASGFGPVHSTPTRSVAAHKTAAANKPPFNKIFRWQPSDANALRVTSVEVVGSFSNWQPLPMSFDTLTNTWQVLVQGIPGNQTHRYMLLVNGQPASDKNSDGLAVPHNPEEQKYQFATARGPRVFLLFAQTK